VQYGKTALLRASENGWADCVQMLLSAGAHTDLKDINGKTALMWASENSETECMHLLLIAGAAVNVRDDEGKTALVWAAANGYVDSLRLLFTHNADFSIAATNGFSALMYAKANARKEAVKFLTSPSTYVEPAQPDIMQRKASVRSNSTMSAAVTNKDKDSDDNKTKDVSADKMKYAKETVNSKEGVKSNPSLESNPTKPISMEAVEDRLREFLETQGHAALIDEDTVKYVVMSKMMASGDTIKSLDTSTLQEMADAVKQIMSKKTAAASNEKKGSGTVNVPSAAAPNATGSSTRTSGRQLEKAAPSTSNQAVEASSSSSVAVEEVEELKLLRLRVEVLEAENKLLQTELAGARRSPQSSPTNSSSSSSGGVQAALAAKDLQIENLKKGRQLLMDGLVHLRALLLKDCTVAVAGGSNGMLGSSVDLLKAEASGVDVEVEEEKEKDVKSLLDQLKYSIAALSLPPETVTRPSTSASAVRTHPTQPGTLKQAAGEEPWGKGPESPGDALSLLQHRLHELEAKVIAAVNFIDTTLGKSVQFLSDDA